MTKSELIINKVLLKLRNFKDFDNWWGDLQDNPRDTIERNLVKIVEKELLSK